MKTKFLKFFAPMVAVAFMAGIKPASAFRAPNDQNSGPKLVVPSGPSLKTISIPTKLACTGSEESAATDLVNTIMKPVGSQAVLKKVFIGSLGHKHFRFRQHYKGLPVIGGDVVIHVDTQKTIYRVTGKYASDIDVSMEPSIEAPDALKIGLAELAGKPGLTVSQKPSLVIHGNKLAYFYILSYKGEQEVGQWYYYVNAHTGEVLQSYNNIKFSAPTGNGSHQDVTGYRLSGEDGSLVTIPGWKENSGNYYLYHYTELWGIYDTDVPDWEQQATSTWGNNDPAAVSLGLNLSLTQNWVLNVLGRDSFDNAGAFAVGNVHVGTNYVNAYWDGYELYFGDGDGYNSNALATLDIAAHEYGHAITQYTSDLNYSYEPGALNESFSDIMGAAVEFATQGDGTSSYPSGDPGLADWLLGEDCWLSEEALRDLKDPQRYGQPSYYKGTNWYTGPGDNGGVHYNSGVQNFAFYLLSEGGTGTNDGQSYSITGIGVTSAAEVAMRANTVYLTSTSQYSDAREAWTNAASDLGYDTVTVEDVWTAVGVGGSSGSIDISQDITPPTIRFTTPGDILAPIIIRRTNNSSSTVQFTVTTYLILPNGTTRNLGSSVTESLNAGESTTNFRIFRVSSFFGYGMFSWGMKLTDSSGNEIDNDSFVFFVASPSAK